MVGACQRPTFFSEIGSGAGASLWHILPARLGRAFRHALPATEQHPWPTSPRGSLMDKLPASAQASHRFRATSKRSCPLFCGSCPAVTVVMMALVLAAPLIQPPSTTAAQKP